MQAIDTADFNLHHITNRCPAPIWIKCSALIFPGRSLLSPFSQGSGQILKAFSQHIAIAHKAHVAQLCCSIYAAFGKAGFGKEIEVSSLKVKQAAALNQSLQHTQVNFVICPLALAKEGGVLIRAHDVDFLLGPGFGISAPPAAKLCEAHGDGCGLHFRGYQ